MPRKKEEIIEEKISLEINLSPKAEKIYEFAQAFRIFKRKNKKAESWNSEAVRIFVKKRLLVSKAPLQEWFKYFNLY